MQSALRLLHAGAPSLKIKFSGKAVEKAAETAAAPAKAGKRPRRASSKASAAKKVLHARRLSSLNRKRCTE